MSDRAGTMGVERPARDRPAGAPADRRLISIVTPAFNEAKNLPVLYERLRATMDALQEAWEWVIVDDHSRDDTFAVITALSARDPRVRGLRFTRNFGAHLLDLSRELVTQNHGRRGIRRARRAVKEVKIRSANPTGPVSDQNLLGVGFAHRPGFKFDLSHALEYRRSIPHSQTPDI